MNPPETTMKKLQAGDVIQKGDQIQRHVKYSNPPSDLDEPSHLHPDPCADFTFGRTILPGDLMVATYFRP